MNTARRKYQDATTNTKREDSDELMRENRLRNDRLTLERRERADKNLYGRRLKNDEMTAYRREIQDLPSKRVLALLLVILLLIATGVWYLTL